MVSRSGLMCRPCNDKSSPVLTIAVTDSGGTTVTRPLSNLAAPTPPQRTTIFLSDNSVTLNL